MMKGKTRWTVIDDNTWDMLLGKAGKLPGKLDKEIIDIATVQNREFFEGRPQDLYPNCLDTFRAEMDKNNWDYGKDDEELFELAMHPRQYRNYKSGKAKEEFEVDLATKRKTTQPKPIEPEPSEVNGSFYPKTLNINVNGEVYKVIISYHDEDKAVTESESEVIQNSNNASVGPLSEILAPIEGNFCRTKNPGDKPVRMGDVVKKGDIVAYIESMKVYNAITTHVGGKIVEICFSDGSPVEEDDVIIKIE
jgi:pyruvate carboxylase subunit B